MDRVPLNLDTDPRAEADVIAEASGRVPGGLYIVALTALLFVVQDVYDWLALGGCLDGGLSTAVSSASLA